MTKSRMPTSFWLHKPKAARDRRGNRRRLHRQAKTGGYFWLPCPVCGEEFGGQEDGGGLVLQTWERQETTCPNCPGHWINRDGRYYEVVPQMQMNGTVGVAELFGSSEWYEPNPR